MSAYEQNYQKLISEKGKQVESALQMAIEIAMNHHMHNVVSDTGGAYSLIDMLTLHGQSRDNGKQEIELLVDAILVDTLMAYEGILDRRD